jgi:hypothetical protein
LRTVRKGQDYILDIFRFFFISLTIHQFTHHTTFSSQIGLDKHLAFNMESNNICGTVLTKSTAQHYLELTQSFYNIATYMLHCDDEFGLASQKQDTWSLRSARHPDPLDEHISDIKARIHSRHVGAYEDWKEIKYESMIKWPTSEHDGSLWNIFSRAMAQDQPIYEMRNWFSHDFGKRGGALEEENERFKGLQEAYKSFLPTLAELQLKLEEALQDEAAWVGHSEAKARRYEEDLPEYTKDTMVVQLKLEAARKKLELMMKQPAENGEDTVAYEKWDPVEVVPEEWSSNPEAAALWASTSNTNDDISEYSDGLPPTSTQPDCDSAYESGSEDDDELPSTVCKACGQRVPPRCGISNHSNQYGGVEDYQTRPVDGAKHAMHLTLHEDVKWLCAPATPV